MSESMNDVQTFEVVKEEGERLGLALSQDLLISNVVEGSAAWRAGLRRGMRPTAVCGTRVETLAAMSEAVAAAPATFSVEAAVGGAADGAESECSASASASASAASASAPGSAVGGGGEFPALPASSAGGSAASPYSAHAAGASESRTFKVLLRSLAQPLGLHFAASAAPAASASNVASLGGVFVRKVDPAGPAHAAGLREGMRITSINKKMCPSTVEATVGLIAECFAESGDKADSVGLLITAQCPVRGGGAGVHASSASSASSMSGVRGGGSSRASVFDKVRQAGAKAGTMSAVAGKFVSAGNTSLKKAAAGALDKVGGGAGGGSGAAAVLEQPFETALPVASRGHELLLNDSEADIQGVAVSVERLLVLRQAAEVQNTQVDELLAKHRKNNQDTEAQKEAVRVLQSQCRPLDVESRALAGTLNRSKMVEAETLRTEERLREIEDLKESDLTSFMELQASLKAEMRVAKGELAELQQEAEESGVSLSRPEASPPASPLKRSKDPAAAAAAAASSENLAAAAEAADADAEAQEEGKADADAADGVEKGEGVQEEESEEEEDEEEDEPPPPPSETERLAALIEKAKEQDAEHLKERATHIRRALTLERSATATQADVKAAEGRARSNDETLGVVRKENAGLHEERKRLSVQVQEGAAKLEETVAAMMAKVREAGAEKDRHLSRASDALTKVQEEEAENTRRTEQAEGDLEALKKSNKELAQQNTRLMERQVELVAALDEAGRDGAELEDARLRCEELEKDAEEKAASAELMRAQDAELHRLSAGLEEEASARAEELAAVTAEMAAAEEANEAAAAQLAAAGERVQELEPLVERAGQLEAELEEERLRLATETAVCGALAAQLDAQDSEAEELRARRAAVAAEVAALEAAMAGSHARAEEHARKFSEQVRRQHAELLDTRRRHADADAGMKGAVGKLQRRLRATEGRLKSSLTKVERLETRLRSPLGTGASSYDDLKNENERLALSVAEMQTRLRTVEAGKKAAQEALLARQLDMKKKDAMLAWFTNAMQNKSMQNRKK